MVDGNLCLKLHIEQSIKLKLELRFSFRNSICFTQQAQKKVVEATFLPVLNYGHSFYRHTSKTTLCLLDYVYIYSVVSGLTG